MGNLKTLRGLLACIAFLESASTNSVNAQCQDHHVCAQYRFPSACEGKHKEWYLKNCPKSCKACPADQLSNMYMENSTIILISSKSTIPEERNVTDVNKVSVQPERTTGTTRILLSTGGAATCLDKAECSKYRIPLNCPQNSWFRQNCRASCNACPGGTSKTTRTSTRKAVSGACKDDKDCTKYKNINLLCSGTDGWYREHCRLSCNMCITDQVSVTRDISHTATSPVRSTNVSVQVHDGVTLAPSQPQSTVVTTWIPSPAASSGACKDDSMCTGYEDFPHLCSGTDEWYRKHCRLSCNMCITDQVSVTRDISHTSTTSQLNARKVNVQVRGDVSQASGVCKDDSACTRYKDLHRLCSGTDGWFRQHCRLSCNMCITDQVSVTRVISHTSTTSPVKAMNVSVQVHDVVSQATSTVRSRTFSVQVHDDVSLATSPAKSRNVSEQVRDDVSQDFPESASHLPSPYQNVIIAVVIIAVIILIVFIAGVVIFKKRRDKSSGKNPLQPTHKDMWSSDGQVVFTNVYEQTVLFSPDQRDQSSDQNDVIDINPPKQSTEETEVRDTCTVSVNKDGLVYSILDFKDFQPKDFVPPTERIEYATIDFGGTISCTKNTRD